jgi:hypothetical protein
MEYHQVLCIPVMVKCNGVTTNSGGALHIDSTFTGNVGTKAYTISDVVKALKNKGLLASD